MLGQPAVIPRGLPGRIEGDGLDLVETAAEGFCLRDQDVADSGRQGVRGVRRDQVHRLQQRRRRFPKRDGDRGRRRAPAYDHQQARRPGARSVSVLGASRTACQPAGTGGGANLARAHMEALGIAWGPNTERDLSQAEGVLNIADAAQAIRDAAAELEPAVREVTGASAAYDLTIETVDTDDYWGYWLDGAGRHVRLRINTHGTASPRSGPASSPCTRSSDTPCNAPAYAARCAAEDVPWLRVLSVHALHQVASEGLAQALPLFVTPDDDPLITRVRLDHYLALVRAELHIAINTGATIEDCAEHARAQVPFWTDATIADLLADRGANPLLRSYLWSYPAGLDWFTALTDRAATVAPEVLRAAYREPLTPDDLAALWPTGRLSAAPEALFVYGSLLFPEVMRVLLGRTPAGVSASVADWRVAPPWPCLPLPRPRLSPRQGQLVTDLTPP